MPVRSLVALVTLVFALTLAGVASAATRYAAPTAMGTGDCTSQANACTVNVAIGSAGTGDDVYVPGNLGDYTVAGPIHPAASGIHVHGTNGRPRLIVTAPGDLRFVGASSTAENLYMQGAGPSTTFALDASGDSADNVIIAGGTGHACYLGGGGMMTNSVCWAGTSGDLAVETDGSNTFRNDTFLGGSSAAVLAFGRTVGGIPTTGSDTLVNVIARSGPTGYDLKANAEDNTADATINVTYSNYATTFAAGTASRDHINGGATDQTAAPLFSNPAGGDFHQALGSPTINAGVNDPANGAKDFDGDQRIVNGTTDIGADEFLSMAPPPPSNAFTIVPRITCAGVCHVILVKITFDSAGNVIAQQALPNQLLARGAVVKKKPTLLVKKLRQAVRAGKNTLRLKLTATAIKTLKKKGRLRIRVRFTFTPTGGTAKSRVKAFTVKLPKKH